MQLYKLIKLLEENGLRDGVTTCVVLGFVLMIAILTTASIDLSSKRFDMIKLLLLCIPVSVPALFQLCRLNLLLL